MITGDHHSTAIAVAKDVGMVKPDADILLIDAAPQAKAHPPQLLTAEQAAEGLPVVSTPSPKTRVRFDFDGEQLPVDQSLSASALSEERQGPAGSLGRGLAPAALADEGQHPAALTGEEQPPAALIDGEQAPADLINHRQGQLPDGLIHDRWQPAACTSQRQLPTGPMHEGQAPSGPDPVSAAPAATRSSSRDSLPCSSPAQPLEARVEPLSPSSDPTEGLSLTGHADQHSYSVAQAMTAMAEGRLQCALTGAALDHLLQRCPVSMIETVMRTAVVFARMKPHQKGQVMGLLGSAGLHYTFQGQSRHLAVSMQPIHVVNPYVLDIHTSICAVG